LVAITFAFWIETGVTDKIGNTRIDSSSASFAFDSDESGAMNIVVANLDESDIKSITHSLPPQFSGYPRWSPDHTKIAFMSDRDGDEELYVMDADGQNVLRVTYNPGEDWSPAWTPDGSRITFVSGPTNHGQIYIIDADGTNQQLLGHSVGEASGDLDWSPDGEQLLFVSRRDHGREEIYVFDSSTGVVSPLTHSPGESHSSNPSWSPSGNSIVFTSDRHGKSDVYRMDADGSDVRRLTHTSTGKFGSWAAVQSPDGRFIIFSSDQLGDQEDWRKNTEIFVIDAYGSHMRRITSNQSMDAHPDW
jgi:TolB protein